MLGLGYHPAKLQIYQDLIDEQGAVGIMRTLSQGNFNVPCFRLINSLAVPHDSLASNFNESFMLIL